MPEVLLNSSKIITFRLRKVNYKLRRGKLGLRTEVIRGDEQVDDDQLQTFNARYPRGGYFGLLALIGPSNLIDIHPSYQFTILKKLEINLDWDAFWR